MNTLSATASLLTHSLAWALLHSLWQGLVVYSVLFVLLKAVHGISAKIKYYLSFGALCSIALWFADTWMTEYQKLKGFVVYITGARNEPVNTTGDTVRTVSSAVKQSEFFTGLLQGIEHNSSLILMAYTLGLTLMLCRFLVNIVQLRNLRTHGLMPLADKYYRLLADCQAKFDITGRVQLYLSNRITAPMMLGTLKPIILLPLATINHLTTEQVEAILLHELAHIKRHDYLLNILQAITEILLFFNPFVWLTSVIVRREREHCCDDLVISCSNNPLPYAKALATLENLRINNNKLALAATGNKHYLFNRIKRIMEMKKKTTNYGQLAIIALALAAITITIATFTITPSFAQKSNGDKTDSPADTATKKTVYKYKKVTVDQNGRKTVIERESSTPIDEMESNEGELTIETKMLPNGTKVVTRITTDSLGRKRIIEERSMRDEDNEVVIKFDDRQMRRDMEQMGRDLKQMTRDLMDASIEIKSVDWNKVLDEISKGLKELDKELNDPKLRKEIKIELERSKASLEEARRHMEQTRQTHVKITANASAGDDEVITEDVQGENSYDAMLEKMGKDGVIDIRGNYTIKKVDGELYINGALQPRAVYDKYQDYLRDKKVVIKGRNGSLRITVNN